MLIAATSTSHAPTVLVQAEAATGTKRSVRAIPDTGADVDAAGPGLLENLGLKVDCLASTMERPQSADGSDMRVRGSLEIKFSLGTRSVQTTVYIIENLQAVFLSWKTTLELALIPQNFPAQIKRVDHQIDPVTGTSQRGNGKARTTRESLMVEYPEVFDGVIRVMPGEAFRICLRDGAKPFCVNTPRRIPLAYREPLKAQLDQLREQGIIQAVTEPTEWCSPIVVVPKKESEEVHLCVDFTRLNKFIVREGYQSPTPLECVASITAEKAKMFSSFDALKGYHQCPLDPASQELTTFITPFGRFKYLRAPFGLSSIAALQQENERSV